MALSDTSSYIETTLSEDERIEQYTSKMKDKRESDKKRRERRRQEQFQICFKDQISIGEFFLPGMRMHTCNYNKVKLSFIPSEVAHVSKKIKFFCVLNYSNNFWTVGKNTVPGNYKNIISELFYGGNPIVEESLYATILEMHDELCTWAANEEIRRRDKYRAFKESELDDIELDSDDEELFLSDDEKEALHHKRKRIWERMIPPKKRRRKRGG